MHGKHVVLIALVIVGAHWVEARLTGMSLTQLAHAQAKSPEARKWEYCSIQGVSSVDSLSGKSSAIIRIYTTSRMRFETLECPTGDPLSFAVAKLGLEGWEFVGKVEYSSSSSEYRPNEWLFKRPAL